MYKSKREWLLEERQEQDAQQEGRQLLEDTDSLFLSIERELKQQEEDTSCR